MSMEGAFGVCVSVVGVKPDVEAFSWAQRAWSVYSGHIHHYLY